MADSIEKQCKTCRHWQGTICEFRPWPTGEACADWEEGKPTSDLINRQTAINTLLKAYPLMQKEKLVEVMETVPAEVVRCKNCKHYYFAENRVPEEQSWVCDVWHVNQTAHMGYCFKAERRER